MKYSNKFLVQYVLRKIPKEHYRLRPLSLYVDTSIYTPRN